VDFFFKLLRFTLLSLFFCSSAYSQATNLNPVSGYRYISGNSVIAAKNYYFLHLLNQIPEIKKVIAQDSVFHYLLKSKQIQIRKALDSCKRNISCLTNPLKFSEEEIQKVGSRIRLLYATTNALGKLYQSHIIPSGKYYSFQSLAPAECLVKAWEQDAKGINFCIGVYAEGKKPNYPLIDSISFKLYDSNGNVQPGYWNMLYNFSSMIEEEQKPSQLFFSYSLSTALYLLEINEREQAADYEPLELSENKKAYEKNKTIRWSDYPYSVIVIPGAGPEDPKVPLSAEGMIRCRLAAIQYKKGLAPFIIPSGGKVHPYKTPFCEALEMKKYMITHLQIPESAIIIEPHARHTTTNMRNSVRLMFWFGIPFQKMGLVCTTKGQSNMVTTTLLERCMRELKIYPYKNGKRLSETLSEFTPLLDALHINSLEPIDP